MQFDQKQLFQLAQDCPWYLFTGEEISALCNVGEDQVRRIRNAPDSPFRYNKCRPEWLTEWMLDHPEFPTTQTVPAAQEADLVERCAEAVRKILLAKPTPKRKDQKKRPARTSQKMARSSSVKVSS